MIALTTEFETEEGVHVDLKAHERAVDFRLFYVDKDAEASLPLDETFWLNANEAESLGHALIAMARASRTIGVEYQ